MKNVKKDELKMVIGGACYHRKNSNGMTGTHYKTRAAAAKGYKGTIVAVNAPHKDKNRTKGWKLFSTSRPIFYINYHFFRKYLYFKYGRLLNENFYTT